MPEDNGYARGGLPLGRLLDLSSEYRHVEATLMIALHTERPPEPQEMKVVILKNRSKPAPTCWEILMRDDDSV